MKIPYVEINSKSDNAKIVLFHIFLESSGSELRPFNLLENTRVKNLKGFGFRTLYNLTSRLQNSVNFLLIFMNEVSKSKLRFSLSNETE